MKLHHVQSDDLDLRPLCHVEEDDEAEAEGVNDGRHLVAVAVRHEVLEDHGAHGDTLEEEQQVGQEGLQGTLKLEGQQGQAEDYAEQDEKEDLRHHAWVEREQGVG